MVRVKDYHRAKSSMLVIMGYMSPRKFCVHFYVGFAEQHRHCLLYYAVGVHALHFVYRKKPVSLSQTSVYTVKHISVWNCTIWNALSVFHYSGHTISTTKSVYEMHISIFFLCKYEIHSANASVQRKQPRQSDTAN